MSARFLDKVLQFIGLQEQPEEEHEVAAQRQTLPYSTAPREQAVSGKKRGQLISLANRPSVMRVVVLVPRQYEDVAGVADHLKAGRPVIIRLDDINRDVARRIVDFTSGSAFALDGSVRKIAEGIFLLTPPNIEVDTEAALDSVTWPTADEAVFSEP